MSYASSSILAVWNVMIDIWIIEQIRIGPNSSRCWKFLRQIHFPKSDQIKHFLWILLNRELFSSFLSVKSIEKSGKQPSFILRDLINTFHCSVSCFFFTIFVSFHLSKTASAIFHARESVSLIIPRVEVAD